LGTIQHYFASDLGNVLPDATKIEANLAAVKAAARIS
jgi:hypothetical protein